MLPFTKRPGKEESSDVVAKEALSPASASRPSSLAQGGRQHEVTQLRESSPDLEEDEHTGIVSSKALSSGYPQPLPAAGRPATMPPPSRSARGPASPSSIRPGPPSLAPGSMRPPPSSGRGSLRPPPAPQIAYDSYEDEDAEDDDGGRTVVKPEASPGKKVVRRASPSMAPATSSNSTSVSPAAVIRKTQDSVRASQRPGMLAPAPVDVVHDNPDDYTAVPPARAQRAQQAPSSGPRSNYPPMSYEGPPSHRPPPRSDRRPPDSYDDAPPRSIAPPPQSSARNGRSQSMGGHSQPPPSSHPAYGHKASQMPYQQTMDVTGESGSSGYHTGPPQHGGHASHAPPPSSRAPSPMSGPGQSLGGGGISGMANMHDDPSLHDQYPGQGHGGQSAGYSGTQLGHANTMPAHMMSHPQGHPQGMSAPPPPMSSHPAAMPAHFRLAQTGAITPQRDPPALTASNLRSSSRPAISWAMALAAAGVFVGVVAVAITQREPPPDPQAQLAAASKDALPPPQPQPQPTVAPTNALPPGLLGASPSATSPTAALLDPSGAQPAGPAPPAGGQQSAAGGVVIDKPIAVPKGPRFAAAPPPKAPRPPGKPKAAAGDDDDDEAPPKKAPPPDKSGGKKPKPDTDEETRKALEALQKAQLESSSSFK